MESNRELNKLRECLVPSWCCFSNAYAGCDRAVCASCFFPKSPSNFVNTLLDGQRMLSLFNCSIKYLNVPKFVFFVGILGFLFEGMFTQSLYAQPLINEKVRYNYQSSSEVWLPFINKHVEIEENRKHQATHFQNLDFLWQDLFGYLNVNADYIDWFPYFSNRFHLEVDEFSELQNADLDIFQSSSLEAVKARVSKAAREKALKNSHLTRLHLDNPIAFFQDFVFDSDVFLPYTFFKEETLHDTVQAKNYFLIVNFTGEQSQILKDEAFPLRSITEQQELGFQIKWGTLLGATNWQFVTRHGGFAFSFTKPLFVEFTNQSIDNFEADQDVDLDPNISLNTFLLLPHVEAHGVANDITIGYTEDKFAIVLFYKQDQGSGVLDIGRAKEVIEDAFNGEVRTKQRHEIQYQNQTYTIDIHFDDLAPFSIGYSFKDVFRIVRISEGFTEGEGFRHDLFDDFFSHHLIIGLVF